MSPPATSPIRPPTLESTPKSNSSRVYIGPVLKYSRFVLELFLRHGMPLLDKMFAGPNRDHCLELLKTIQRSTKYLHAVSNYSKSTKDSALANYIPPLRKAMESILYRVQAMLALNNELKRFWLGNLVNKDLKGEKIQTQPASDNEEEDRESVASNSTGVGSKDNEELPEEDQSDIELDDDDNDEETSSPTLERPAGSSRKASAREDANMSIAF